MTADGPRFFLRGFLLGALAVALLLGPELLEVQHRHLSPQQHSNAKQIVQPADKNWRHLADLLGLVELLAVFARALHGPLSQWFTLGALGVRTLAAFGLAGWVNTELRQHLSAA